MTVSSVVDSVSATANVRVRVHDADQLRQRWPDWSELSKDERLECADATPATRTERSANTSVDGLHDWIVNKLDPNQSQSDFDASHLALGDDDGTQPSRGDTSLNNEVERFSHTRSLDQGSSLEIRTFIDTTQGNGSTFKEVGLITSSTGGTLLNHALINDIVKTVDKTATIDVVLAFAPK